MTISQKLIDVNTAKTNIKAAIEAKGVDTTGVPFTDYHTKIGEISGGGGPVISNLTWTRNAEWLTVTPPSATENKIVILAKVADLNGPINTIGFQIGWSGVQPTVDWGDGTVEPVLNNTDMFHQFDFTNPSIGGLTSEGYKQVIITIDAPSGSITKFWFQRFLSGYTYFDDNALELHFSAPNCTDAQFGASQNPHSFMEYLNVVSWDVPNYSSKFAYLHGVFKIDAPFQTTSNTRNVAASAMFNYCYNLYAAPAIDYSAIGGSCNLMFTYCGNIRTFSNVDMTGMSVTGVLNMFQYCYSLVEAPDFNTTNVNNFSQLFQDCYSLLTIPDYNTTNVTNLYNCFVNCTSLETLPNWNTSNVTNWQYTFSTCQSLREIPTSWDFSAGTSYNSTFQRCYRIKTVNNITFTSTPVETAFMFQYCSSLNDIKPVITSSRPYYMFSYLQGPRTISNVTASGDGRYMFRFGQNINEINDCNFSGVNNTLAMFAQTTAKIKRFKSVGPSVSFDLSGQELSANAIDEMFSLLPTVTSATVNVSNNPGSATCTPSIATAKGWTVTS